MSKKFYIRGFDGLRAFSILLVVLNHAGWFENVPDNFFWRERVWRLISGEAGVNLFFAISGFLITVLLLRELKTNSRIDFKAFFIRRFLRLMPPLFVFLVVIIGLDISGILNIHSMAVTAAFLYLYNYLPQKWNSPELTHTWSLGVEEQFYLTWPFVIHFFRKKFYLLLFLLTLIGVALLFAFPFITYEGSDKVYVLTEAFRPFRWILPAALPILSGAFTGFICFEKEFLFNIKLKIAAVICFFSVLIIPENLIHMYLVFQSVAYGILLATIYQNQNSFICSFLEIKPIVFIGRISYSIYIWQGLFLRTGPGSDLWFQSMPMNILLTFIISVSSYFFIEQPFAGLRSKFRDKRVVIVSSENQV